MPRLNLEVPETQASATRPIVFGVVRDLFKYTGIPEDTMISYPGDTDSVLQPGSDTKQEAGINTFPFNNRVFIEVDENYEMDRILSTAVYMAENKDIFIDDALGIYLRPVYSSADMTINFKYRSVDKTACLRWRDGIRTRVAMNWDMRNHELAYHYLVPKEYLVILHELHRMREAIAPYGEGYNDYLLKNFSKRATVLTNQIGTHGAWAISEKQIRIIGYFDFDTVPELGNKEDEGEAWTISFSYKFKYDKPIACVMDYPLVIHNQLVDQKYRPNPILDKPDSLKNRKHNYSLSSNLFAIFEKNNTLPSPIRDGIAIPSFDEFVPDSIITNSIRILTVMVTIDTANPTLLLNLKELGDFYLHPAIIRLLTLDYLNITKPNKSIFQLSLYKGRRLVDNTALRVDSYLNVYSVSELSLRESYHVRLSVVKDISTLGNTYINFLRNNGDALIPLLGLIDNKLQDKNLIPTPMGSNSISSKTIANNADLSEAVAAAIIVNQNGGKTSNSLSVIGNTIENIITDTNNGSSLNITHTVITSITTTTGTSVTTKITTVEDINALILVGTTSISVVDSGNNYISKIDLDKAINAINMPSTGGIKNIQRNTVQTLSITANRR